MFFIELEKHIVKNKKRNVNIDVQKFV